METNTNWDAGNLSLEKLQRVKRELEALKPPMIEAIIVRERPPRYNLTTRDPLDDKVYVIMSRPDFDEFLQALTVPKDDPIVKMIGSLSPFPIEGQIVPLAGIRIIENGDEFAREIFGRIVDEMQRKRSGFRYP